MAKQEDEIITMTTVYSLVAVVALLAVAHQAGKSLLPKRTRKTDQAVFVWLVSTIFI